MTSRIIVPSLTALATLVILAALACGPVAQSTQEAPAAPTAQPATPALTATPSSSGEATPLPTKQPTDTPAPIPAKPKKTPRLTLPPKPTETPVPPLPTPDHSVTPSSVSPHPGGLTGCLNMNIFATPPENYYIYSQWCNEEVINYVVSTCKGLGTSETELDCGARVLSSAGDYSVRIGAIKCLAVTDKIAGRECLNQAWETLGKHDFALYDVWPKVQIVVARDPRLPLPRKTC